MGAKKENEPVRRNWHPIYFSQTFFFQHYYAELLLCKMLNYIPIPHFPFPNMQQPKQVHISMLKQADTCPHVSIFMQYVLSYCMKTGHLHT